METKNTLSKKIQLLPEHLVDQIKAGEVVERPSALLKELLENSIDANSTQIDIHICENGMDLISVEDNGEGMSVDDLPYAFCRHATSKISRFEDLYQLSSFGFRGEALASIAASARLTCITSPKDNLQRGGKIVIHGGQQKSLSPHHGKKAGTSLFIKDLFFNTPARLKFVKSKTSEKNSLKRIINSFILSNPSIEFRIKWDDADKVFFPTVSPDNIIKRIHNIFFRSKNLTHNIFDFKKDYDNYYIFGHASEFSAKGNAGKSQYLFINGRLFTDRAIHQAVIRSMDKIWRGQVGHYFVSLNLPPDEIDVNVHPSKTIIKFNKLNQVISIISAAIKDALIPFSQKTLSVDLAEVSESDQKSQDYKQQSEYINYLESFGPGSSHLEVPEMATPIQKKSNSLININDNYFIGTADTGKILINKNKLLSDFLMESIFKKYPINEHDTTPLLIGTPFPTPTNKIIKIFTYFSNLGLVFDKIDSKTILLRTTPSIIQLFPIDFLVKDIFMFFEKRRAITSEEEFISEFKEYLTYSTYGEHLNDEVLLLELYRNSLEKSQAIFFQKKIGIALSDNLLGSLFL